MSREPIRLNPQPTKGGGIRYPKMHRGHRFPCPVYPEDSRRNRSDAWQKYLVWRAGIDQTEQDTRSPEHQALHSGVDLLERSAEYLSLVKRDEEARLIRNVANGFRQEIGKSPDPVLASGLFEILRSQSDLPHKLATVERVTKQKDKEVLAKTVAEQYLSFHATRARSGQITAGTFGRMRSNVNTFLAWFGEVTELTTITNDTVRDYHTNLLNRIAKGESSTTMWGHQQGFQQFLEWAGGQNDEIPIPRNLRDFTITKSRTEPDPFTVEEFRLVYDNATERTKLYL